MKIPRRNNLVGAISTVACILSLGLLANVAGATDYHVGANQALTKLTSVPWDKLLPGDNVYIHAQPQPYRENILISQSGTAANHIRIIGVADPVTHLKPVIDGTNASQASNIGFWSSAFKDLGAIIVSPHQGFVWGSAPSYIDIENLDIRNANQTNMHTNYQGQTINYHRFACAIYVEVARHLAIRNCELSNCGNGLFVNSKYGGAMLSADILVESCYIHHNGNPGSFSEHNCYTECNGITYQFNRIGPLTAGANGDCIKDRSANTVVRNNWIEPTGYGQAMELICTQSDAGTIQFIPGYDKTFVYGNIIDNGPAGTPTLVTYGGDMPDYTTYRHGTLYFFNNTIYSHRDWSSVTGRSVSLFLPPLKNVTGVSCIETIDCRNNVIYNTSSTPGAVPADFYLMFTNNTPTLNLGTNWLSPNVGTTLPISNYSFIGTITGLANSLTNGSNNPGFTDVSQLNLRPAPASQLLDSAGPQAGPAASYSVNAEFSYPFQSQPRSIVGPLDLGALEGTTLASGPPVSVNNLSVKKVANSAASAQFTVSLLYPYSMPVSIDFGTADGSAHAGTDYTAMSGTVNIPAGSLNGLVTVPIIGNGSVGTSANFTLNLSNVVGGILANSVGTATINFVSPTPPSITSFSPGSGAPGTVVTVNGANLTGISSVTVGGTSVSNFTTGNGTSFTFTVPVGAVSGPIKAISPSGSATSASNFVVIAPSQAPTILSISPGSGPVGTVVLITGTNFTGATGVSIHDVVATFVVINSTTIKMTMPVGAITGKIRVDTSFGKCWSINMFQVTG